MQNAKIAINVKYLITAPSKIELNYLYTIILDELTPYEVTHSGVDDLTPGKGRKIRSLTVYDLSIKVI